MSVQQQPLSAGNNRLLQASAWEPRADGGAICRAANQRMWVAWHVISDCYLDVRYLEEILSISVRALERTCASFDGPCLMR